MPQKTLLAVLVLALAGAIAGCPGSLEDPSRFDGQFGGGSAGSCPDIPMLIATRCATAGCHASVMSAGGLDLASADIIMRLSGKKPAGGPGLLVDPADPHQSVLYTKLTSMPPFGSRMPLSGMPFDDATELCVLSWITSSTKGGT